MFLKILKVFLQHTVQAAYFKMCTYASGCTYGGISLHIYMRKPTRTYASGHTDVRMHKLTHIYVMTVGNKLLIQNLNNLIHIPTE